MSYGMMEFYSTVLGRNAEFRFILPDDARARRDMFKDSPAYRRPTKTIYLLNVTAIPARNGFWAETYVLWRIASIWQ